MTIFSLHGWRYGKNALEKKSKLTKYFYRNGQNEIDHKRISEKSAEYTRDITEAKEGCILKLTNKL